jgi:TonB family protein
LTIDRYITVSLVFHLLLLGYFGMIRPAEEEPRVFDVKIVTPADITEDSGNVRKKSIPEKRSVREPPAPQKKPVIVRRRRPVNIDNDVKPDVLFGEGLGEAQKDVTVKEDSGKPKGLDSKRAEKEDIQSLTRDSGPSASNRPALDPGDILFDKKTIEKYASKSPPDGTGDLDSSGVMFYAPEFENRAYMRMLRDRIESIWKYPREAARRGRTGDLYIKFSIKKNGELNKIELVRTSGHRDLDEAAIQALKKAEPYWPLPENYDKDVLEITGHFIYVLGSTYVM